MRNIKRRFNNKVEVTKGVDLITTTGNGFFAWNGNVYESDIIRAAIRPKVNAVGKLKLEHIRKTVKDDKVDIATNPEPYLRMILMRPNPYMSMQKMLEKLTACKAINNNAFALIVRDDNGLAREIYPIYATHVDAIKDKHGILYLRFTMNNTGQLLTFRYSDIIHLRKDLYSNDIFGEPNYECLKPLMEIVTTTDQGVVNAIKNSNIIRWLLRYGKVLDEKKLRNNVKQFVQNFLNFSDDVAGVAAIDGTVEEIKQIEPKDFVPNASQMKISEDRIYSYLNTNKKIVQSDWTEDEWNSYFEAEVEPDSLDIQNEFTWKLFSRREIACGNSIYAEATNLACASIKTKLAFVEMVDRGAWLNNEWRELFNRGPIEGGDKPIRRLDTATVTATKGGEKNED